MRNDPIRGSKSVAAPATVSGEPTRNCHRQREGADWATTRKPGNQPGRNSGRRRRDGREDRMTQIVSSITGSWLRLGLSARQAGALAAIVFGIALVGGTGFAGSHALHEGTHDTRHAFGLPCH